MNHKLKGNGGKVEKTTDELIMQLTDAGLCLYKRSDGSYYERNKNSTDETPYEIETKPDAFSRSRYTQLDFAANHGWNIKKEKEDLEKEDRKH
jgi:hypothetical protein